MPFDASASTESRIAFAALRDPRPPWARRARERRLVQQAETDVQPSLHAARSTLSVRSFGTIGETDRLQDRDPSALPDACGRARRACRRTDRFSFAVRSRVDRDLLRHEPIAALTSTVPVSSSRPCRVTWPASRDSKRQHHGDRCRLSRARLGYRRQADYLALADREADAVDGEPLTRSSCAGLHRRSIRHLLVESTLARTADVPRAPEPTPLPMGTPGPIEPLCPSSQDRARSCTLTNFLLAPRHPQHDSSRP